jgi:hypothetical protein
MIHSLQKLTVQYSCFLTDLLHFLELHMDRKKNTDSKPETTNQNEKAELQKIIN